MRIGFCLMEAFDNRPKNAVGSSRIRGRWVIEKWNELYPNEEVEEYKIGRQYDVLIFQKVYWDLMLNEFKGKKIIDLCDPDWLEGKDIMKYVNKCDLCTTSTEPLAQFVRKFVKNKVTCIPDRIKLEEHKARGKHEGEAKVIGWFGYAHNQYYLTQTLEVLAEKRLRLKVISNQPYTPPSTLRLIEIENIHYSYPSIHDHLSRCDLFLSPERLDEKGIYKSNNKELTAKALGVPVVASADDLDRLMNPDERNKQVELDKQEILDKYDIRYSVEELRTLVNEICK